MFWHFVGYELVRKSKIFKSRYSLCLTKSKNLDSGPSKDCTPYFHFSLCLKILYENTISDTATVDSKLFINKIFEHFNLIPK